MIPGYNAAQSERIRLSSLQNQVLRESNQHDLNAGFLVQHSGATTGALAVGQAQQDQLRQQMGQQGLDPNAAPQRAALAQANPMSPQNDMTLGQGLAAGARRLPRMLAGGVALPYAAGAHSIRAGRDRRNSRESCPLFAHRRGWARSEPDGSGRDHRIIIKGGEFVGRVANP